VAVKQLSRQTLRDRAYETIKEAILKNELAPGQALSIEELASSLNTSPTPVREALAGLAADGLVHFEPHRRVRVAPLTEQAVRDAFEARRLLEPWLAREAARKVKDSAPLRRSLELLRRTALRLLEKAPEEVNLGLFVSVDLRLHDALRRAVDNKLVAEILDFVGNRSLRIRTFVAAERAELEMTREHLAIIEHVMAGSVRQAGEATLVHLRRAEERTLRAVTARLESEGRSAAAEAERPQGRGARRARAATKARSRRD
jgi:DNA-binding GntR family transcriptional regulator